MEQRGRGLRYCRGRISRGRGLALGERALAPIALLHTGSGAAAAASSAPTPRFVAAAGPSRVVVAPPRRRDRDDDDEEEGGRPPAASSAGGAEAGPERSSLTRLDNWYRAPRRVERIDPATVRPAPHDGEASEDGRTTTTTSSASSTTTTSSGRTVVARRLHVRKRPCDHNNLFWRSFCSKCHIRRRHSFRWLSHHHHRQP